MERRHRDEGGSGRDARDDRDRGSRDRGGDDRGRDRDEGRRGGARSGSSYEYKARSAETVRDRAESGDFDKFLKPGIRMWKPRDGSNRFRIVPPTWKPPHEHYGLDVHLHYGVGADRGSYLCLKKMRDEPDPICDERQRFARSADLDNKDDKDYMRELEPRRRVLIYLVDRDDERAGVQAWSMPYSVDREITGCSLDPDTKEVLNIDNPDDGYDVLFTKTGKGVNTKYESVQIARRSSPLGRDEWMEWALDHPLDEQLVFFPYDHIAREFGSPSAPSGRGGDDRGAGRDRDRDTRGGDDRGGRDRFERDPDVRDRGGDDRSARDRDRDRDDRGSRDRDRGGDDRGRDRVTRERTEDAPITWDAVHGMRPEEMADLIELKKLDINPREAKDTDDLADWVCEELKIEKEAPRAGRDRDTRGGDERGGRSDLDGKLDALRNRRRD